MGVYERPTDGGSRVGVAPTVPLHDKSLGDVSHAAAAVGALRTGGQARHSPVGLEKDAGHHSSHRSTPPTDAHAMHGERCQCCGPH